MEKEFSQEIDLKEKEILQIQERLHKALKIFHLLRYVIISNFYNHKHCQVSQITEAKQTRIHPAVKSLLGKCPKSINNADFAVPSTSKDPRFLCNDESLVSDTKITTNSTYKLKENPYEPNKVLQNGKRVLSRDEEESRPLKVPRYVPPKSNVPENAYPSRGNSHKVCKRIIVGNISKWIPPDWREDASSHKWTMYVRGDKDNADISTFVSKVRFFLHPSYRPNDVVEITTYPFHLSRRGWGEFPIRVQLHFKNILNKPMDIIHHLKLDRTYTGLQTLGSETLVDVWINLTESRSYEQSSDNKFTKSSANDVSVKTEVSYSSGYEQTEGTKQSSKLTACAFEKVQIKQEIIDDSEICELSDPTLSLAEKSEDVTVKVESNSTIGTTNGTVIVQNMRECIELDHDYFGKQYSNSYHCIVKDGNITIEHFSEDNYTLAINSSVKSVENRERKKFDDAAILHKSNGSTKSSKLQVSDSSLVISESANSENKVSQESNGQISPISKASSQVEYLKNDNNSKLLEDTSTKDGLTTVNGFCKSPNVALDQLNCVLRVADSSQCNSALQPLQITIPSSNVLASSNKHILVLKDKKSIPVDVSILSSNSKKTIIDGNAKIPIIKNSNISKVNVHIPQGISILKKSANSKTSAQQEATANNSKKTTVLTVKRENSVLLNVNEDVPILKIVDPNDPHYNYNPHYSLTDATRCLNSESNINKQEQISYTRLEKPFVQRAKITLGKDKYKLQSKRDLYETILQSINTANITDTEALIRYVIRRLPIITSDAHDFEYRRLHPYACRSEEEFFTYNIGKQRALEWYRAKTIKHFLQKKLIATDQSWTIKEIVTWARLHGYTPIRCIFNRISLTTKTISMSNTKKLPDTSASISAILSTCTDSVALQEWLQTCRQDSNHGLTDDVDVEEIDVESVASVTCRTTMDRRKKDDIQDSNCSTASTLIPLELDESLLPFHNFVCDSAQNIGIKIGTEEIVPGVLYCAASRVLMRVWISRFYYI